MSGADGTAESVPSSVTARAFQPPVTARRALADVAIQVTAQIANLGLGIVVTALIARHLGAVSFGQWSSIFAAVELISYFADFKLQAVTVREVFLAPEREGEWLGALLGLSVALALPAIALAAAFMAVIARSGTMRIAGLIVALTIGTGALSTAGVVFQIRVRNDLSMLIITVNSVAWFGAVAAITALNGGMVPLAAAFTATSLLSAGMTMWVASRRARIQVRGSMHRWGGLFRAGLGVGIAGLLTLAYGRIDQLIVYGLAPHQRDAGLYAGVYRILNSSAFVPTAVMTTLVPMIAASLSQDTAKARKLVSTALHYLSVVSLPVLAFSLVGARPLLHFLLGNQFLPAANTLPVLMGAYVAICWGYVAGNVLILLGLQGRLARYAVVALVLNVGMNLALVPTYGYQAAAWVTLTTEVVVQVLSLHAVFRSLDVGPDWGKLSRVVAAAGLLVGSLAVVRSVGGGLAALVGTSVIVYPTLCTALGVLDWREVRRLAIGRHSHE